MPRGKKSDIFALARAQAAKALATIDRLIREREADLRRLLSEADRWRKALGVSSGRLPGMRGPGRPPSTGAKGGPRRGGKRVSWDEVLASVPAKFGVEDVLRHPGAAAKGRPQIYPALNRWEATKRIRRISKGLYEKLAGTAPAAGKRGGKGRATRAKKAGAAKRGGRKRQASASAA